MPSLLSSAVSQTARNQHLLLLQSSTSQTCLTVLRAALGNAVERARETTVLFCLLYPPSSLLGTSRVQSDRVHVLDKTANVPGYCDDEHKSESDRIAALKRELLETIRSGES